MNSLLAWTPVLLIIGIFAFSIWFVSWRMRYRWRLWIRILLDFGISVLILCAVWLVATLQSFKLAGIRMQSKAPEISISKPEASPPPRLPSTGPASTSPSRAPGVDLSKRGASPPLREPSRSPASTSPPVIHLGRAPSPPPPAPRASSAADSTAPRAAKKRGAPKKAAAAPASLTEDELWQRAVDSLPIGAMLVNHPPTMRLHKTSSVVVRISAAQLSALNADLDAANVNVIENVRISDYTMKVRLGGAPYFDVTPLDSEEQALGRKDFAEWKFNVTPLKAGRHIPLHLTVVAVLRTPWNSEKTKDIPVKDEYVDVQVTVIQRVGDFLGPKWQWIAGSLVIPLMGWLWKRYSDRKNNGKREKKLKKFKKARTGE